MKQLILTAGAIALVTLAPAMGLAAERTYDLPAFTAIDISSGIDAEVTVGGTQSIKATAPDESHLDELKIDVQNGTLKVWRDWDLDLFSLFEGLGDPKTKLTIAVPALTSAAASAGSDVDVSGMSGEAISIEASSGAELKATDLRAVSINANASSGSDLSANGTCATVTVNASSGADIDFEDLACTDATVNASSGSDVELHANGALKAEASSGSDIKVRGTPKTTEIEESSGGRVDLES
ncbi:MAG TPA: head GIN domain-containing protein [Devosia sp.]